MLVLNPDKRFSAKDCLRHSFFEPPKVYEQPVKRQKPKIIFETEEELKKMEEEKKKQEELAKKKTFVDELAIIPQTNEYQIMFGVPDKISKLKDGVFFDPKKIKLKYEKE